VKVGFFLDLRLKNYPLVSKIQYNNCELGEYKEEKDRTPEETIRLIDQFPWKEERKNFHVGLTGPSITLQNIQGGFLKLAPYYNGKFALYYFAPDHSLYLKSLQQYDEAYPVIRSFFATDTDPFDTTGFQRQHTWPAHNFIHFIDRDFHYSVTSKRVFRYLLGSSGISFALSLFVFGLIGSELLKNGRGLHPAAFAIFIPILFLMGGGLNLILFANYYRYAAGKLLVISQGSDLFYYGPKDQPLPFDKKDIMQVTRYEPRGGKNPIGFFMWVEIEFKDARSLAIPNLLIDSYDLEKKLAGAPSSVVLKPWPSINPSSASVLS
jgi:hypothetical protein